MKMVLLFLILIGLISCNDDNSVNNGNDKTVIDKSVIPSSSEQILESTDGIRVIIPGGALNTNLGIKLVKLANPPKINNNNILLGTNIFKLSLTGELKSNSTIQFRVKYDKSKVKSGNTITESVIGVSYKSNTWISIAYQLDIANEEIVMFYSLLSKYPKDLPEMLNDVDLIFGDAYSTTDSGQNDNEKCDCGWAVDYTKLTKVVSGNRDLVFYMNEISAKHGPEIQWFDGTRKQLDFTTCWHEFQGIQYKHGFSASWWKNGNTKSHINYLKGQYNGIYKEWFENGKSKRVKYWLLNASHGPDTTWYENGQIKLAEVYLNNKENGLSISWYDNGNKFHQGAYKDGNRDALWQTWHSNGIKSSEGNYILGIKDGFWNYWHDNGNIESRGQFSNGNKKGIWTYFGNDGNCIYKTNHDTNETIKC
jgi:antitoxin component YwqK of YwqJK toxin-antitoxin module